MKDETLLIVIICNFTFLQISFWNIIPNKMESFLLGHAVYASYSKLSKELKRGIKV